METADPGHGVEEDPVGGGGLQARVAIVLVIGGAVLVAVSGFLAWLDVLGSTLSGYRLAELVTGFGDELSGVPPGWVGVAWYAIPAAAAISWILAFRHMPPSTSPVHVVIGAGVVATALGYMAWVDVQAGPIVAALGGSGIGAGATLGSSTSAGADSRARRFRGMGHTS